ncbi:hypothetical protein Gdia_3579 (plasmid) [Gluconacetobacter diazotrophicus PA1 5]|nr:hypothetical protein Gdia_3579 [Gluconacetobacter diazotrophicus PA1 5]TWB00384.1 hypothetical protein FBZ86_13829 [Gluconacetobacter diazotrophicus]
MNITGKAQAGMSDHSRLFRVCGLVMDASDDIR